MNLRTLSLLAALALLAFSCTSGTEGIFASIEREQKIVSLGGLNKSATVTSMAEFNGKYYATGGKALFSRATTGTAWDKSTVGGSGEVASVGATAGAVFAVSAGKLYASTDGTTWNDVTPSGGAAYSLVPVVGSDGYTTSELLLVTDVGGDRKTIYHVTGAGVPTQSVNLATSVSLPSLAAEVVSAVKAASNQYYLASAGFLWSISSATWSDGVTTAVTGAPTVEYSGLLVQGGKGYLSSRQGALYRFVPSGSSLAFTTLSSGLQIDSGHTTWLHKMLWNTVNSSVWIATGAADSSTSKEGNGYLEWDGSILLTTPSTNTNNYTSSALPTAAVGALFRSSSGDYYLGTIAHGLWKWDSSAKTWSQQ